MKHESSPLKLHPLVFYQRPQIGNNNSISENPTPVQIVFPNGGFGLGIPIKNDSEALVGTIQDTTISIHRNSKPYQIRSMLKKALLH